MKEEFRAGLSSRIEKLTVIQETKSISHFAFLKNVTTIATGLLALLVSLKSNEPISDTSKWFFVLTILFLGVGVIFSLITQYSEVYSNKGHMLVQQRMINEYMDDPITNQWQSATIPTLKLFTITEGITYILLMLSLITLIAYVFCIEFRLSL